MAILIQTSTEVRGVIDQLRRKAAEIINSYRPFGRNSAQISVVTFNQRAEVLFNLDEHTSAPRMIDIVYNRTVARGNFTNLAAALRVLRSQVFQPMVGDRPNYPNVVYLLMGSPATVEVPGIPTAAQDLRDKVIGVMGVRFSQNDQVLQQLESASWSSAFVTVYPSVDRIQVAELRARSAQLIAGKLLIHSQGTSHVL